MKVMIRPEPNDDYEIEDIYDDLDPRRLGLRRLKK